MFSPEPLYTRSSAKLIPVLYTTGPNSDKVTMDGAAEGMHKLRKGEADGVADGVAVRLNVGVGDNEQSVQLARRYAPAAELHVKPPGHEMIEVELGQ